jgi:uncharacterized protein
MPDHGLPWPSGRCPAAALRRVDQPHGYIFEVPADATGPVEPVPLRAIGRYVHKAVAVDSATGIVYCTEDAWYNPNNPRQPAAGLRRFIPDVRPPGRGRPTADHDDR